MLKAIYNLNQSSLEQVDAGIKALHVRQIPRDDSSEMDAAMIQDPEVKDPWIGPAVRKAIAALPERMRLVIRERYGMRGGEPKTLGDVAKQLGLSKERVRQLQVKAERILRSKLRAYAEAV
jgi:RNA polymerase sigma factor (sigma-70 family)